MAAFSRDNKIQVTRTAAGEIEYPPEALETVWPYFQSLVDPEKGLMEKVTEVTLWAESRGDQDTVTDLVRLFGH